MNKNKYFSFKIIIILINMYYLSNFINIIKKFSIRSIIINNEFKTIEHYLKICDSKEIINKMPKKKSIPKVSVISPIHNREKYLLRFINSIQNQKFSNFEIIFIDDFSKDNSIIIIEDFQKKDLRIHLLKNKKNKGTFISRNIGVLNSKGEYLILPDPDDIISKDIINVSYNLAKRNNYEMIRFNIYIGNERLFLENIVNKLEERPIYQPELSTYLFYGLGYLQQIDFNLSNKFIQRISYIKALNYLNKYYLKIYMLIFEDGLMNYFLYRTVKSYYFLKQVGYYYIKNNDSITKKSLTYKTLKYIFIQLKFFFEFSKNTSYEKNMVNLLLKRLLFFIYKFENIIKYLKYDFTFYYDIINKYLKSVFIKFDNKIYLGKLKYLIIEKISEMNK